MIMNDCLNSVHVDHEGVKVAKKLPKLLCGGEFHLTKWLSINSAVVIPLIPENVGAGDVKDVIFP